MIAPNAAGNAVHSTTRSKISQTWLVSHTGPMSAPSTGDSVPSKSIDSIRTWSWKYSRCRSRFGGAEPVREDGGGAVRGQVDLLGGGQPRHLDLQALDRDRRRAC